MTKMKSVTNIFKNPFGCKVKSPIKLSKQKSIILNEVNNENIDLNLFIKRLEQKLITVRYIRHHINR